MYTQYEFLQASPILKFQFQAQHDSSEVLLRSLERELMKSLDFVNIFTAYPLLVSINWTEKAQIQKVQSILKFFDSIVQGLMLYEKMRQKESNSHESPRKNSDETEGVVLPEDLDEGPGSPVQKRMTLVNQQPEFRGS